MLIFTKFKVRNILRRGIDELGSDGKTDATTVAGQSCLTQEFHVF